MPFWIADLSPLCHAYLFVQYFKRKVAKRKTLFDDRPVEISELTYIIKHDIASINKQLSDLQAFQRSQTKNKSANSKDREQEHRGNVLVMLQTSLAGTTNSFQEVLEVRTKVSALMETVHFQFTSIRSTELAKESYCMLH